MSSSQQIRIHQRIRLERCQSWEESFHVFDEESALAVEMALAAGRPLLVRGEPGSGKSQLARAAAQELNRRFLSEVITASTEPQSLLWHYDPVARFHEAQMLAAEAAAQALRQDDGEDEEDEPSVLEQQMLAPPDAAASRRKAARYKKKKNMQQKRQQLFRAISAGAGRSFLAGQEIGDLHPCRSISPGPLWWAVDCQSARQQLERCRWPFYQPGFALDDAAAAARQGSVILLDEIDKADAALPNALLEVLGNGGFHAPLLNQTVRTPPGLPKPLVIITTNEERELPPAFVRRCLVLHLRVDDEQFLRGWWNRQPGQRAESFSPERAFVKWLAERGETHFAGTFTAKVRERAAELLARDRREARQAGLIRPGQAEYLDLLRALRQMAAESDEQRQLALLEQISPFVLVKDAQE
ncbi:AAA family ATPase [Candidatus Electronema sp. JC]|uniref:AAA family ATPase n=1 Tax=Candidatus Electronema sp. JC TaxID=3401570 RepID=UPI003AA9386B